MPRRGSGHRIVMKRTTGSALTACTPRVRICPGIVRIQAEALCAGAVFQLRRLKLSRGGLGQAENCGTRGKE